MTKRTEHIKKEGKKLWIKARDYLEAGDLKNFFAASRNLRNFLFDNKTSEDALLNALEEEKLNLKALKLADTIRYGGSKYSRAQGLNKEGTLVAQVTAEVNSFINAKYDARGEFSLQKQQLENTNLKFNDIDAYIALMTEVKNRCPHKLKNFMSSKITQLKRMRELPTKALGESVEHILQFKGLFQKGAITKFYKNKSAFFHATSVDASQFKNLKNIYLGLRGDTLKARILSDFTNELSSAPTKDAVITAYNEIKDSAEYKVLKTGQGLTTRALHMLGVNKKTDSIKALENIVDLVKEQKHAEHSNTI